ncbi:MAG: hypothetical protein IKZ21_03680 [Clostridia bacterium]|nr:hypothetical protein [Clostridia bacterium]
MKMNDSVTTLPKPTAGDKRAFAADAAKAIGEKNGGKGILARMTDRTPRLISGVYGKTDALSDMVREDFKKRGSVLTGAQLAMYDGIFTGLFARSAGAEKKFDYPGFAARRAGYYGAEEVGEFARLYQKGFRMTAKIKELRDPRQIEAIFNEAEKHVPGLTQEDKGFFADLAQMLSEVLS